MMAAESTSVSFPPPAVLPNACDWAIEKCHMVGTPLLKCQQSGCSKLVHHVCLIEWVASNNLDEGGIATFCRQHHPQYCQKITANSNANPTERRPTSAEEKARMDAVLAAIGPPPEWFNDVGGDRNDDDSGDSKDGESGGSAFDFSFNSPEGIEMRRATPGTSES
jgi:hypothetical protein